MQQPHTWPCFSFHFVHRNIWCDLSNIISSLLIPNISAYSAHISNGIDKKKLGHSTVKSFFIFAVDRFLYSLDLSSIKKKYNYNMLITK